MRLSKIQIAGVVLAVAWAVIVGITTHSGDVKHATDFANFSRKACIDGNTVNHVVDPAKCDREWHDNYATFIKGDVGNTLFAAFAPIPILLLAAFCLLYFMRAQIAGFRTVVPWSGLSRWKKGFVVFCVLFVAAAGLFSVVVLMNQAVDANVPVMLTLKSFENVAIGDDQRVEVVGTWTRTDLGDTDTISDPLQTSRIVCVKSENRCTEAKAYVSGRTLFADEGDYTVASWTSSAIVLRNDFPCATEVFTIDLNTEVVSGEGHKTNGDSVMCKTSLSEGKDSWSYLLEDGFKVYWQAHQKQRPFALRVFQTLAGN